MPAREASACAFLIWISALPLAFAGLGLGDCSMLTNGLVSVPIVADDANGVAGMDLRLTFDSTDLSAQSASKTALTSDLHVQCNPNVPGEMRISLARATGMAGGSGTLLNVIFDVSSRCRVGDAIPITLTVDTFCGELGEPLPCTTSNGVIRIEDNDTDELPDVWEQRIVDADPHDAITSVNEVLSGADFDGDGVPNGDEFTADTDACDADSFLCITKIEPVPTGVQIDWQGGVWANQQVERTEDLTAGPGAWSCIRSNAPPTSTTGSTVDSRQTDGATFYRIKAGR